VKNSLFLNITTWKGKAGRSQWPRCLRHELTSLAVTLASWIRIPLKACVRLFCACVILYVSNGLATG
jgi:hypothetical protein